MTGTFSSKNEVVKSYLYRFSVIAIAPEYTIIFNAKQESNGKIQSKEIIGSMYFFSHLYITIFLSIVTSLFYNIFIKFATAIKTWTACVLVLKVHITICDVEISHKIALGKLVFRMQFMCILTSLLMQRVLLTPQIKKRNAKCAFS